MKRRAVDAESLARLQTLSIGKGVLILDDRMLDFKDGNTVS